MLLTSHVMCPSYSNGEGVLQGLRTALSGVGSCKLASRFGASFLAQSEMQGQRSFQLWSTSAITIGAALPFVILYRPGIMYTLVTIGLISGLLAVSRPTAIAHIRAVASSKTAILIGCMFAAFFVSSALGNTPLYSLRKWAQLPLAAAGALALYIALAEMPARHRNTLLASLTAATVIITLVLLIDMAIDNPAISYIITGDDRPAASRFRSWSSASAMLLPFIAAWLYTTRNSLEGWAPKVILAVCALCLIVTGGRAGWVGAIAALCVWVAGMMRWHDMRLRPIHLLTVSAVALAGIGSYVLVFGSEFVTNRLLLKSSLGMMSGRLEVWRVAIDHMGDNPLFGIGLSGYRHLPDATFIHPHNWFLQMGLETGLIGTLLYCTLLGWTAYSYLTRVKNNIYALAGLSSLTAFAVSGLANTSIFNMWWVTYFIVATVLGVVLSHEKTDSWNV